jgi:hypothetical protein
MILLLATLLAAIPLPPEDDGWLKLTVENFHIISNASAKDTERLTRELANIARSPVPARVVIFKNAVSFAHMRDALFQTLAAPASGLFFATGDENFIIIQADAGLEPIQREVMRSLPRGRKTVVGQPLPATRPEVLAALGHVLARARSETYADAEAYLTEALRLNGEMPAVRAELFVLYGTAILNRLNETRSKEDVAKARGFFERASQLDPSSARAWAGLGATYIVSDDDPGPGIAALEKSLALLASQDAAAVNLVRLYVRVGRQADAQKLFDSSVASSSNADIVRLGREALSRQQKIADEKDKLEKQLAVIQDAMEKAAAADYAGALAIIDAVLPEITDEEFRGSVQRLRADVAGKSGVRRP